MPDPAAEASIKETISEQQQQQPSQSLSEEYADVVQALEQIETKLRIKHIPSLTTRAPYIEVEDLKEDQQLKQKNDAITTTIATTTEENVSNNIKEEEKEAKQACATISKDGTLASLRRQNLRTFSLTLLTPSSTPSPSSTFFQNLTTLDVSKNELSTLPGLSTLSNLQTLNLERNWFNTLPPDIGTLSHLQKLIASRNFLRPNATSLHLSQLQKLQHLEELDLSYNQKCGRSHHRTLLQTTLPQIKIVKLTLWEEVGNVSGSYVGSSAAERNAMLLRSQLEPMKTVHLRQRLVRDFGQEVTDAAVVNRAGVMQRLLRCYREEGLMEEDEEKGGGVARRKRIYVEGTHVNEELMEELMVELKRWTEETGKVNKNRERPSIRAKNYMILRTPHKEDETNETPYSIAPPSGEKSSTTTRASRRATRKAKKLSKYKPIWDLALRALQTVDPKFAKRCTEIAVTYGFTGSPHIDKQNCGPFYGLALGNFPKGQGGICVECSARVVAVVDTRYKIGRVDGRYPHWVDGYSVEEEGVDVERYSLIYYETGNRFVKPGPAIFTVPKEEEEDVVE